MGTNSFGEDLDYISEAEFDPLAEEELSVDQDVIDDDNINDIVEMPLIPNMPEGTLKQGIFDAQTYEDPRDAITTLFEKNPGRCPVFLEIIALCENGKASSEIVSVVDEIQSHNKSVYAPLTLCRALEQAGALVIEVPESALTEQDAEGEYLVIQDRVDPIWTSTQAGLDILHHWRGGGPLQELLEADHRYLSIYKKVLAFCTEAPRTKKEIDHLVDHDPLVQNPRRFSNHFIELLEKADALIWKDNAWHTTDLGRKTLESLEAKETTSCDQTK